jgi:hypothetical protein
MTARSAIRYAHNGDVSIAYMESGSGADHLTLTGHADAVTGACRCTGLP